MYALFQGLAFLMKLRRLPNAIYLETKESKL